MRKKIALLLGSLAGVVALGSALAIGIGVTGSLQAMAAAREPLTESVIESGPPAAENETPAPVVSNLPAQMIAGLPEYTASHDRDTYIRVQTWIKLCMSDRAGHSYAFDPAPESGRVTGLVSTGFIPLAPGFDQHEQLSLYGEPGNLLPDYGWERGGCYGEALHKSGLLDGGATTFTDDEIAQIDELYGSMTNPPAQTWGYDGETPGGTVDAELAERVEASIEACMAAAGVRHSFEGVVGDDGSVSLRDGSYSWEPIDGERSATFDDDALVLLFGPHQSAEAPYDWSRGGCYGQAVHDAGLPGAR